MASTKTNKDLLILWSKIAEFRADYEGLMSVCDLAQKYSASCDVTTRFIADAVSLGELSDRRARMAKKARQPGSTASRIVLSLQQKKNIRNLAMRGLPWAGPRGVAVLSGIHPRAWDEGYAIFNAARSSLANVPVDG